MIRRNPEQRSAAIIVWMFIGIVLGCIVFSIIAYNWVQGLAG